MLQRFERSEIERWAVIAVEPLILEKCQSARSVCSIELAADWVNSLGIDSKDRSKLALPLVLIEMAIESLTERGVLRCTWCVHAKLAGHDPRCSQCGIAVKLVETGKRTRGQDRQLIWETLCRNRQRGLTREELSAASKLPEKTVCWAIGDYTKAGIVTETDEQRLTTSGRMARVIKPTCAAA